MLGLLGGLLGGGGAAAGGGGLGGISSILGSLGSLFGGGGAAPSFPDAAPAVAPQIPTPQSQVIPGKNSPSAGGAVTDISKDAIAKRAPPIDTGYDAGMEQEAQLQRARKLMMLQRMMQAGVGPSSGGIKAPSGGGAGGGGGGY